MLWDVNSLKLGQRPGKWTEAPMCSVCTSVSLSLQTLSLHWSCCLCVCLQAVITEAPTSLQLSYRSRGAWAFQCPIHKRAEPSGQPTQMLCIPTKGHPPTPCCLNDSQAHVTAEKKETQSRLWSVWSVEVGKCWEKYLPQFLWNFSLLQSGVAWMKRGGPKVARWSLSSDRRCRERDCFDKVGLKVPPPRTPRQQWRWEGGGGAGGVHTHTQLAPVQLLLQIVVLKLESNKGTTLAHKPTRTWTRTQWCTHFWEVGRQVRLLSPLRMSCRF